MNNRTSARFKPYPAYKDSGVEWLGGDSHALGGEKVAVLLPRHRGAGCT